MPFFSICIPAYKRSDLLKRLLQSISEQAFRDFEVIVTDDSPDDSVKKICSQFHSCFELRYFKNDPSLGTPENWNAAIRQANGQWIKIMHDDDWLADSDALNDFKAIIDGNSGVSFVFAASTIVHENGQTEHFETSLFSERLLVADPANLFHRNFIGPPSVIAYKADKSLEYDQRMKWLVDVDFYFRYLSKHPGFAYTRKALVRVGFNPAQVTNAVIHDRQVVLPETFLFLQKTGTEIFRKVWNYDAAWRLLRNYNIRKTTELESLKPADASVKIPKSFYVMIRLQKFIPRSVLRIGVFSKFFMFISYLGYRLSPERTPA